MSEVIRRHLVDMSGGYLEPSINGDYVLYSYHIAMVRQLEADKAGLVEALDTLILVVGLTAFKHEAQRAVLQEAVDAGRAAISKARSGV